MRVKFLCLVLSLVLFGCVTTKSAEQARYERQFAESKQKEFLQCIFFGVDYVDDGVSDASTIAYALTNRCGAEYQASIHSWGKTLDNERQYRMFVDNKTTTSSKIEASLPIVLGKRNGTLRARE